MSEPSVSQLIDVAKKAAAEATAILVQEYDAVHHQGKKLDVTMKTSEMDLVTEIDQRCQDTIVACIQEHFPEHRFLAEEKGADDLGNPNSPYRWIIDPLDGTTNFIHGRESFGSIVAVEKNNTYLAGAMHIPLFNQWFYGGKGEGAYYNDSPVTLRNTKSLEAAVLNCNLIHRAKDIDGTLHISVPLCRSIENYGSAVEELGEILRGHTDGVFFHGIRPWDIATGFLLIEEAGGKMAYEEVVPGNPREGYVAAASTAPIFDDLWHWVKTEM